MTRWFVILTALLGLAAQESTPPQGDYCWTPASAGSMRRQREQDPHAHQCACHLRCEIGEDGAVIGDHEDATCKLYCRRDACQCHTEEPCEKPS